MASRCIASMPATTASRLTRYSSSVMRGTGVPSRPPRERGGVRLVRGKGAHRFGDLLRAGHEELLLRAVERHRGNVWRRDAHDRTVEAVERVLRDGRRNLRAETAGQVVLVHDHRLAGLLHRGQDGAPVQGGGRSQVGNLEGGGYRPANARGLHAEM